MVWGVVGWDGRWLADACLTRPPAHGSGTYTGTFKDRRPDGSGRMQYADGSTYEGGFKDFKVGLVGATRPSHGRGQGWRVGRLGDRGDPRTEPAARMTVTSSTARGG